MATPYLEGSTWSVRLRIKGHDVYMSGYASAREARIAAEQKSVELRSGYTPTQDRKRQADLRLPGQLESRSRPLRRAACEGVWRGGRCLDADPAHAGGVHGGGSGIQERKRQQGLAAEAKLNMHWNQTNHPSNAQPNAARSSFWIGCEGIG